MNDIASITNPFVGLRPFKTDESILFFGRQKQILELLERLHEYQFVGVTGSSGCGKSSLIRAGLIPRLKAGYLVDNREKWIIAVMKPGESPLNNLANALAESLKGIRPDINTQDLTGKINETGVNAILEVLNELWEEDYNFFLLVDQFEELFPDTDQKKNEISDEAIDFVNILLKLSAQKELPVYVVITMRSDYIGDCSQFYNLPEALNQSQYLVPRLNRVQLKSVIEGPVKLLEGRIHPALTERILNDAQNVKIELPLLQHVLMRIWEREKNVHQNGQLDLDDYREIGGIKDALSNHAEETLARMSLDEINLTQKIFQALARIDERGRKTRRRVHLKDLIKLTRQPADKILSIIERFRKDGSDFLITDAVKDSDDLLIDISHESLITQWGRLDKWVDDEAASAKIYIRLADDAEGHEQTHRNLLEGDELHFVSRWYETCQPDEEWAQRYKTGFQKSIAYLKKSEDEERRKKLIRKWNRRLLLGTVVFVSLLISAFAIVLFVNNIKRKKELTLNYWNASHAVRAQGNYLDALHLIATAAPFNTNDELGKNLLIDAESFLPQARLENIFIQPAMISSVCFSPDGKWLLTAGYDGNARILDATSGKLLYSLFKHNGLARSAVFSADGKQVLTAGNDHASNLWDIASGRKLISLNHEVPGLTAVTDAVFGAGNRQVLTAADDGYVRIWNIDSGRSIDSLYHASAVTSLAINGDGQKIVAAFQNGDVLIWDQAHRKKPDTLKHNATVTRAIFSPDGKKIVTACDDSYARIWDAETLQSIDSLKHKAGVTNVTFSPDGKWMATACHDKTATVWNAFTGKPAGAAMKDEGAILAIAFSPDGKWIATAGAAQAIRVWSVASAVPGAEKYNYMLPAMVNSAVVSPDGTSLLTACEDHYARIRVVGAGNTVDSFSHTGEVFAAVYSPDGKTILTGCKDSTIHVWDIAGKKKTGFLKQRSGVTSVAFSPDGKQIVVGCGDRNVRLWETGQLYSAKTVATFPYPGAIHHAVISPDNKKIAIAGSDKSVVLYDLYFRKELMVFRHDDDVQTVSFSPDGKWILTASWDMTARTWNVITGKQVGPSMKHTRPVNSAVFDPAEKRPSRILTAAFDGYSHLWSAATKREIGLGNDHEGSVACAGFSPDGKWIVTASQQTVHVWERAGDLDMPADLFRLQVQAATGVLYNVQTGETECMAFGKWRGLKDEYERKAKEHYTVCRYRPYNFWTRFSSHATD